MNGFFPARLLMLMIDPPPRCRSRGIAFFTAVEHSAQVGFQGLFPCFKGKLGNWAKNTDTRIVYKDVQPAEILVDELEES